MWAATDPDLEKEITGSYEVSVSDDMDMVMETTRQLREFCNAHQLGAGKSFRICLAKDCIIGAGSLVTKNTVIPDGSLVMGSPARIKRNLTWEEYSENIRKYIEWELNARIVSLDACEPYELLVKEMQELIQQTLDKLPERTRKIFILSRYENKSYKEIAALMNMTTKGVDFHICKALKALQINLKDYFPLFLYFLMRFH